MVSPPTFPPLSPPPTAALIDDPDVARTRVLLQELTNNHGQILDLFTTFIQLLAEKNIDREQLMEIIRAVRFAANQHAGQLRKDGKTPYIIHPLGVAMILLEEGGLCDPTLLSAALLHDTVEDTSATFAEIEETFGDKIRWIVFNVSDEMDESNENKAIEDKAERKRAEQEHARQLRQQWNKQEGDPQLIRNALLLKLADKLNNWRDLELCRPEKWSTKRVEEYRIFARSICAQTEGLIPDLDAIVQRDIKSSG